MRRVEPAVEFEIVRDFLLQLRAFRQQRSDEAKKNYVATLVRARDAGLSVHQLQNATDKLNTLLMIELELPKPRQTQELAERKRELEQATRDFERAVGLLEQRKSRLETLINGSAKRSMRIKRRPLRG